LPDGSSFEGALVKLLLVILTVAAIQAATPDWLARVEPVISPSEKKAYLALTVEERRRFEQGFWAGKRIGAEEYFTRLAYVDATFGSNRPGSGANTDPGRVYLSLGAPTRITRLPSSRVFVTLEIWYYDAVPGVLNTELRLIFYRKANAGFPKLYSPVADTIRALLVPQAATRSMFGPNDSITESDIRKMLKTGPAEDEVITAALAVASGIKDVGNDEILSRIGSPREMLLKAPQTEVTSRLIVGRPKLDILQTASIYGGTQVDFRLETKVGREIMLDLLDGSAAVYRNQIKLALANSEPAAFTQRLDLLPGSYRVVFTVDGRAYPYVFEVPAETRMGEVLRVDAKPITRGRHTPFEFDGQQLELNPQGRYAAVAVAQPGIVTWMIRRGTDVVWKSAVEARQLAMIELPSQGIAAGIYRLEAATAVEARSTDLLVKSDPAASSTATVISFNANLAPPSRLAFAGHQWLLRGKLDESRRSLEASLAKSVTDEAQVELARIDVIAGNLDAARDRVNKVLSSRPNHLEALTVLAYIEARLQDYPVAAELYRRALALQDSPALRAALAQLLAR
jgi:GWxTD domain-containing protein